MLIARRDGLDPFDAVFDAVGGESQLAATVESSKKLIRPLDLDSRDLIQTQYAFVRGALMALYEAIEVRAVRGTDPALEARMVSAEGLVLGPYPPLSSGLATRDADSLWARR